MLLFVFCCLLTGGYCLLFIACWLVLLFEIVDGCMPLYDRVRLLFVVCMRCLLLFVASVAGLLFVLLMIVVGCVCQRLLLRFALSCVGVVVCGLVFDGVVRCSLFCVV